ncbi:hypothetical protein ABEB36_006496 [Hypothenemus hampei]|uniref:Lipase n=1 Tax=Hypothenemus hampei TaxID=57062 RepID=A0ABD1EQQ8_HYPHA
MACFYISFILSIEYLVLVTSHPDENLTGMQLIQKYNYPAEMHTYATKDGYILKALRIPHGRHNNHSKESVVLVHGMGGRSENFILLGPPNSLAFYLSDQGYDVWLFNARGTALSRRHRTLNPNKERKKFWNFSWHEMAVYDLPATIDYILKQTGRKSVFYVGHSQGTTILMVLLAELPEYNEKIRIGVLLAPSAYLNYTHSPLIALGAKLYGLGERLLALVNWYEMPTPNSQSINSLIKILCISLQDICVDVVNFIGGTDSGLLNKTAMPLLLEHGPSGFAAKQVWHYAQIIASGEFKQYDYGAKNNMKMYNSSKPPKYDLSRVTAHLALFYSTNDPYSNHKMIEKLKEHLPAYTLTYEVPVRNFNHLDYLIARNLKGIINEPVYDIFKVHEIK